MPFPNHPQKHRGDPLITPQKSAEYRRSDADHSKHPQAVILCYSRKLMDYFTEKYDGEKLEHYYGDLHVFADTEYTVGVLGDFGIGAPTTAMLMEELITDGVEMFLSIGFAGCLDDSIEMGDVVVCEKAIRDEGVSHHYAESQKFAYPSESFVTTIQQCLQDGEDSFHVGPSWTIDAIYRETTEEVERYAEEGVLTVEMEASAVFTVANHRDVEAGAMFVISDYLGTAEWEPKFHLTENDMQKLGDTAKEILTMRADR